MAAAIASDTSAHPNDVLPIDPAGWDRFLSLDPPNPLPVRRFLRSMNERKRQVWEQFRLNKGGAQPGGAAGVSPGTGAKDGEGSGSPDDPGLLTAGEASVDLANEYRDEQHVIDMEIQIKSDNEQLTAHHVILTDSCYYETQPQDGRPGQSLELRQQYPFSQIHSIEPDVYVPHIFYVNFFVAKKVSSKMQLTMNKVKRTFMNSSVSDDGFIVPRAYVCRDALECFQFYMVFSRLLRDWWQQLFEVKYIPEGEVFQSAYFTSKWNKERIMLISDSWIYNITVTYFPTRLGQTKWAIPISCLLKISVNEDPLRPAATVSFSPIKAFEASLTVAAHSGERQVRFKKGEADKAKQNEWVFRTPKERDAAVSHLASLFQEVMGYSLGIVTVDNNGKEIVGRKQLTVHEHQAKLIEEDRQAADRENAAVGGAFYIGCIREGYLDKQGSKASSAWKSRFHVLFDNRVEYYRKKGDRKPAGTFVLTERSVCGFLDRNDVKGRKHGFYVIPEPGGRKYTLAAESMASRESWLVCIRAAIEALKQ